MPGPGAGAAASAAEPGPRGRVTAVAADLSAPEETGNEMQSSQNEEEGDSERLPGPGTTPNLENAVLREAASREGQTSPRSLVRGSESEQVHRGRKIRFGVGSRGGENHLLIALGLVGFLTSWSLVPGRPCWAIKG